MNEAFMSGGKNEEDAVERPWLGRVPFHSPAWRVRLRWDGGERKAKEAMEAAGVPSAA